MDTNSRWKKAAENTDWWMAKYSHIFGIRTHSGPQEYEFISCNDLGVPYFSKVIRGKVQKTKFTLHGCDREWALKKLEEKLNEAKPSAIADLAERINNWTEGNDPLTAEQVRGVIWALAMDPGLGDEFRDEVTGMRNEFEKNHADE